MKNLIKKIGLSLTLTGSLFGATQALAYEDANTTITEVYINSQGVLLFKTGGFSNIGNLGCTKTNYLRADFNGDVHIREIMHRNLLTAKATGATVWLRASGCDYYPLVNVISVK